MAVEHLEMEHVTKKQTIMIVLSTDIDRHEIAAKEHVLHQEHVNLVRMDFSQMVAIVQVSLCSIRMWGTMFPH